MFHALLKANLFFKADQKANIDIEKATVYLVWCKHKKNLPAYLILYFESIDTPPVVLSFHPDILKVKKYTEKVLLLQQANFAKKEGKHQSIFRKYPCTLLCSVLLKVYRPCVCKPFYVMMKVK